MKRVLVAVLLAAVSGAVACGNSDEGQELTGAKVRLKSGESLDGAQKCGVDLPQCPSGLSCLVVELDGKASEALCVNERNICDRLECTSGECAVLDSYPGRVACMGRGGGSSDGDGSVSSP
jgi:hypothetical protein